MSFSQLPSMADRNVGETIVSLAKYNGPSGVTERFPRWLELVYQQRSTKISGLKLPSA